jgi:cytochrome c-type biogenesis protein CcmH
MRTLAVVIALTLSPLSALAQSPQALTTELPLADPLSERRAQALMQEIRCVACENEPLSQSGASIAVDMRLRLREQIALGMTDGEIRGWWAQQYGEAVLFRPGGQGLGVVLWAFPALLLVLGAWGALASRSRRRRAVATPPDA